MTVTVDCPTLVMSRAVLRDAELVLDGVLPSAHLLGGPLAEGSLGGDRHPGIPAVRVAADLVTAEAARKAGGLRLVDDEQTPIATLTDLEPPSAQLSPELLAGRLLAERRRESGEGRDLAVDFDGSRGGYDAVVVLARPPLAGDEERVRSLVGRVVTVASVLVLVPDHEADTAGVPTALMTELARRWAVRLSGPSTKPLTVTVATAPLAWRDAVSDHALVAAVAARVGAPALVLSEDARLDVAAPRWHDVARSLDDDDAVDAGLIAAEDVATLERWRPRRARRGLVVMFTGLSGSGKSTLARALSQRIARESDRTQTLLDGDVVRQMLSSGLGFDRESRMLNVRRIGFVAAEIARHGGLAICAPVAPYDAMRAEVRDMVSRVGDFLLVHVSTPLEECERRDLKGLYARAREGLVPSFTGISDPYEAPQDAELTVDTSVTSTGDAIDAIMEYLRRGGWLGRRQDL